MDCAIKFIISIPINCVKVFMSYKGKFLPTNRKKYKGEVTNVIYRSLWERKFMVYLDTNPDVVEWGSEEVIIPYTSPIDGKKHRYFPDFYVKTVNGDKFLVEIKPKAQTKPPKKSKSRSRYLREVKEWGRNQAKWEAAEAVCKKHGWKFLILTEDHINPHKYLNYGR